MNKKSRIEKKPNGFLWHIIGPLVYLFFYRPRIKFTRNHIKIRKRSIILQPHRSYYDILHTPFSIFPFRAHFVCSTFWFRNPKLVPLLNAMGCIPKNQFRADINAIRLIGTCLKANESIIMYPEGEMSLTGHPGLMPDGLSKLVKKYKANVYVSIPYGAYMTCPRVRSKIGRGRIHTETTLVIPEEKIDSLTVEEIDSLIINEMSKADDFKYVKEHPDFKYIYKDKAKGFDNAIVECPHCHSELSFESSASTLKCRECGLELTFNKYNYDFLENPYYKSLEDLFDSQNNYFKDLVKNNVTLSDKCRVTTYDKDLNPIPMGDYIVSINCEKITLSSSEQTLEFPTDSIIKMVMTMNQSFEIPTPDGTYRCYPENPRRSVLYHEYLATYHETNQNK